MRALKLQIGLRIVLAVGTMSANTSAFADEADDKAIQQVAHEMADATVRLACSVGASGYIMNCYFYRKLSGEAPWVYVDQCKEEGLEIYQACVLGNELQRAMYNGTSLSQTGSQNDSGANLDPCASDIVSSPPNPNDLCSVVTTPLSEIEAQ